ncbi:hypothetical protein [Acinetobacter sp. ANC 3789]|uniref:hypothetical protein n=1 Tax=Acinetobacter sp. ANC 3789 TaxID=1217714 RepID=UPI0002CDF4C9|nr:hypothetical protein [Acinetobacter sp. ANC 3789]ENU80551.1 hypothetical protein F975_01605 [Acinetobacter sp. ANC 3789]
MKKQLIIALACLASLAFTACSKKSEEAKTEQASVIVSEDDKPTTPEQQAQINALDKPVLDEKNTDVKDADAPVSEAKVQ